MSADPALWRGVQPKEQQTRRGPVSADLGRALLESLTDEDIAAFARRLRPHLRNAGVGRRCSRHPDGRRPMWGEPADDPQGTRRRRARWREGRRALESPSRGACSLAGCGRPDRPQAVHAHQSGCTASSRRNERPRCPPGRGVGWSSLTSSDPATLQRPGPWQRTSGPFGSARYPLWRRGPRVARAFGAFNHTEASRDEVHDGHLTARPTS